MTGHEIGFEWALEGKRPGSHDDYELLSWSEDRLGPEVFEEIRSRYTTGLSADLPQLTIAVAATRERELVSRHLVFAIQEWSGHRDATNRKIAYTRWFYVPYEELAAHPVSYEALYHALAALPVTPSPPLVVRVPGFDPSAFDPGPDARCAAALLLTGRPVCVVGADGVPMIERLRFLDTVAALLPYGMRARLTAATRVSSTARHRIRLSFARHAPDNAYEVRWGRGTEVAWRDSPANVYIDLLTRSDVRVEDVLEGLARVTDPLSFGPRDLPLAVRTLEHSGYPELLSSAAAETPWQPGYRAPEDVRVEGSDAEPDTAAGHRNAAAGSGEPEPVPKGPGLMRREAPPLALEPGAGRESGGEREPDGEREPRGGRPASPVGRLTSLLGAPLRRLGLGTGETPAVRPSGAAFGNRAAPALDPAPGGRTASTAATVPHRPATAAGPGAVPPSMRTALGGLEQAGRERRSLPALGPHGRITMAVAFMTLAVTLIGIGVAVVLRTPGDDPPAEGDAGGTTPGVVVVQAPAGQQEEFAERLVAETVRRAGYRFVPSSDSPAATTSGEPALILMAPPPTDAASPGAAPMPSVNPPAARGFSEITAVPLPSRDVLVYDPGLIGPEALAAAFTHMGEKVRISVPDAPGDGSSGEVTEQVLRQRYPWLSLKTVPAADPLRALRERTVQAAVVPRREAAAEGGYPRSEALADLPGRSLLVLGNQAVGGALRDALARVARSVDPGRLVSKDFDSPEPAAAELAESALPPPSGAVARFPEREDDREQGSPWLVLVLIIGGSAAGFLALLLALRLPSRAPYGGAPRPPSATTSPGPRPGGP
ncbi:hypothetical protein [Streptosporangium sandarakinum]|uniref:hypothetical protein n=1 Tax=Streptosporangium sandarakinum TaxID=1260955 RepID=UPI00341558E3